MQFKEPMRLGKPPGTTKTFLFLVLSSSVNKWKNEHFFSFFSLLQKLRSYTLTFPAATLYTIQVLSSLIPVFEILKGVLVFLMPWNMAYGPVVLYLLHSFFSYGFPDTSKPFDQKANQMGS